MRYVADVTPPEQRGAAYGLRQAMDTVGAFAGPLVAIGLMLLWQDDIRRVLWIAVIPAFIALLVLWLGVREPASHETAGKARPNPLALRDWQRFPASFWKLLAVVALFTLMRFSEAFLVLRAQDAGLSIAYAPLALVVMSGVYMLSAWPAGAPVGSVPAAGHPGGGLPGDAGCGPVAGIRPQRGRSCWSALPCGDCTWV